MRLVFGFIVLVASGFFWSGVAEQLALTLWGAKTRALVTHVAKEQHRRGTSYTALYEFTTADKRLGHGSVPSRANAQNAMIDVIYLPARPSVNRPDSVDYVGMMVTWQGGLGLLLALWSARILLRRPKRLGGRPATVDSDLHQSADAGMSREDAPPSVHWRNRWAMAFLLGIVLSGLVVLVCVAGFSGPTASLWALLDGGAAAETGGQAGPAPVVTPVQSGARGATAGNQANGSHFALEGEWLLHSRWREYDRPGSVPPGLYRMKVSDGSGLGPVGDPADTGTIYQGVEVLGGWIYYVDMQGVYRLRVDGSGHKRITKDRVDGMAVVGEHLFVQNKHDHGRLYRLRLDGGGSKRLTEEEVGAWSVGDDGWLYYANQTDGGRIYRCTHDGQGRALVSDRAAIRMIAADGLLWFVDKQTNQLWKLSVAGGSPEPVVEDMVTAINLAGEHVYFSRTSGIARCRFDGSEMETIVSDADVWGFVILGGRVWYQSGEDKSIRSVGVDGAAPRKY